jgi:hypothetical protein
LEQPLHVNCSYIQGLTKSNDRTDRRGRSAMRKLETGVARPRSA